MGLGKTIQVCTHTLPQPFPIKFSILLNNETLIFIDWLVIRLPRKGWIGIWSDSEFDWLIIRLPLKGWIVIWSGRLIDRLIIRLHRMSWIVKWSDSLIDWLIDFTDYVKRFAYFRRWAWPVTIETLGPSSLLLPLLWGMYCTRMFSLSALEKEYILQYFLWKDLEAVITKLRPNKK
jgi:hypothetical protein